MDTEGKLAIAEERIKSLRDEKKALFNALMSAQRSPLTVEQIQNLNDEYGYFKYGDAQGDKTISFVRAIEEFHGIYV